MSIKLVPLIIATAALAALPGTSQARDASGALSLTAVSQSHLQPEVANRKGSHRVGGSNSKGKGSKYVGGRKGGR